MGDKSGIEWTEATWNPVVGCTRVSAGCDNCYAVRQTVRMAGQVGARIVVTVYGAAPPKARGVGTRRPAIARATAGRGTRSRGPAEPTPSLH